MPEESHVDVLIVGAGPAGVMCANALTAAGIHVKIVDQRSDVLDRYPCTYPSINADHRRSYRDKRMVFNQGQLKSFRSVTVP